MQDDLELLWEYGRSGDNHAFSTVASRYIDLIYSAALRQVRDPHVAQDVTQATLIILMNKASSLPRGTVVPGWLLRVTRFAALDAMKLQRRRTRHERQAAIMRSESSPSSDSNEVKWEDVAPQVDEALLKLKTDDRDAVVLRYLLGKTPEEIAWVLNVSEEAARQRVSRALGRLRDILSRSGITAAENAIGSVLMANAVMRAPAALSSIAGTIAAPASGALSAPPAVIANSALKAMGWGKMKWAVMTTLAAAGVIAAAMYLWPKGSPAPKPEVVVRRPVPASPRATNRTGAEIEAAYANKVQTVPRISWAARAGDLEGVKHFIAAGDDIHELSRDGQEMSPLMFAAMLGRDRGYEIVKLLIERGADVNSRRPGTYSALMGAVRHNSPRTVELLLSKGADLSPTNTRGENALDWAKQENDAEVLKLIEEAMKKRG